MSTGKSPGQLWQPWTVDSPSLGLIFIEQPSDFCTVNALIRAKQLSMTISLPGGMAVCMRPRPWVGALLSLALTYFSYMGDAQILLPLIKAEF